MVQLSVDEEEDPEARESALPTRLSPAAAHLPLAVGRTAPLGAVEVWPLSSSEPKDQELEAARTRARLAQYELDLISRTIAHDLRSPLMGIEGLLQVLSEDHAPRLDPEGQRYVELLRQSTRDFGRIIEAIVGLAKLSFDHRAVQPVDLGALAKQEFQRLAARNPTRNVELIVSPSLSRTSGDQKLLVLLVEHLISNSWKFTRGMPTARIELGAEAGRYFVRDDGAGFDMASVGRLFNLFQRLHSADEFEGRGIGLATVRRIVHLHGGTVSAESSGRGATIWFTLSP
jgi:signal transduction histidine kinase